MLTHSYTVTHYSSRQSCRAPDNLIHFKTEHGRILTDGLTFSGVPMGTGRKKYYNFFFFLPPLPPPPPPPPKVDLVEPLESPLATGLTWSHLFVGGQYSHMVGNKSTRDTMRERLHTHTHKHTQPNTPLHVYYFD